MWLLQSRKAQVAMGSILMIILSRLLTYLGFSPTEINSLSTAITIVAGVWIASIAHEDASKFKAMNPPPAPQINLQSDVLNPPPVSNTSLKAIEDTDTTKLPRATPAPPPRT